LSSRLRSLCLAAATAATTITALTFGAGSAAAAVSTTCKPVANIFTMQADGDLWVYKHADPANGAGSWAGAQQVGWGWGGKTFAGADGRLYNITTWGELRRLRYNGGGWDTFPGGGQYEAIGWGWQRYVEPSNRGKITVDANGTIYTLEGDQLRWWHFSEQTRSWVPGSGKVLDVGWSRFDLITASGVGGLQARDNSGTLHRFRYNSFHERFQAYDIIPGTRWQGRDKLFSAGGDVYYAVRPDTGQLLWNRFTEEETSANWLTSAGSVIGWDWGTDVDITATTNDCTVTGLVDPLAGIRSDTGHPTAIMTPASGGTHLVNINSDNRITDTYSTGSGWATRDFGQRYSGISRPLSDSDAGTSAFATTNVSFGAVELYSVRDGQWQAPLVLKGAMDWTPAVVRRANGTLAVYAAGDFNGSRGHVYVREQLPSGEFLAWRAFGNPAAVYSGKPSVITDGDVTTVVVDSTWGTGERDWFRHTPGSAPVRMGTFPAGESRPVFSGDGQGRALAFSYRTLDGALRPVVLREKADGSGFEDNWQTIADNLESKGGVDAHVLPNGTVAVSMVGNAGQVLVTTSVAPGSTQFHPWQQVSAAPGGQSFGSTSLALTRAGDLALTSTSGGHQHLWTASVPPEPATLTFTGGPIT
jgi:hypothetical protein